MIGNQHLITELFYRIIKIHLFCDNVLDPILKFIWSEEPHMKKRQTLLRLRFRLLVNPYNDQVFEWTSSVVVVFTSFFVE